MSTSARRADKPIPVATDISAPFWDGLARGEILIQYSPSTDKYVFYPRSLAPGSLADDLEWREISGRGELFTFTVAHKSTMAAWAGDLPQVVAVVRLDEGPHFVTEISGVELDQLHVGMRLRPIFVERDGMTLLHYTSEDNDD